ncbi:MAG TPA: ParB/RepB/Spo0J family partition protein, partial [Acidimicrobiales bacterium]
MARRPGLGKGLGALIPESTITAESIEVVAETGPLRTVSVNAIRPNPFQPRKSFNNDSLQALASSVKELGVLQPIIVRPVEGVMGEFELIAGERRWRAAGLAGLEFVPVLVQDDVNDRLSL